MNISSFIHPSRTFLPCSGVGRHINNVLLRLSEQLNLNLLVANEWKTENDCLSCKTPLSHLETHYFPFPENMMERSWKTLGLPYMDRWFRGADVVYCPMETYIPLKKIPLVVTIHDIQAFESDLPWSHTREHRVFRKKWSVWTKKVFQHAARVFTVSEYSRQRMIEVFDARPEQIVVVGNGVERQYYEMGEQKSIPDQLDKYQPYLLVVGGLRFKKGADAILKVAAGLKAKDSQLTILVVGEEEEVYKVKSAQFDNIQILGMVEDERLAGFYKKAEALLFLSYYEGFGIPALEAMAVGTPAIVSNRGSLPEIVGEAGLVVDPDDTEAVLSMIQQVQEDQIFRNNSIAKGKQHVQAYTWEACTERVFQALQEVVNEYGK